MQYTNRTMRILTLFSVALCFLLCFSTIKAQAVSETKRSDKTIMEGVTESTVYVTDCHDVNLRTHILRIQSGADVTLKATIKGYYTSGSTKSSRKKKASSWGSANWSTQTLKGLATAYQSSKDTKGTVIAASNGAYYDTTTQQPLGCLVVEGNVLNRSSQEPFFAVMEDGSYAIRRGSEGTDGVVEAVSGRRILVDGGKNCLSARTEMARDPRQGIGVCADGTVVIINVDGREPTSVGATFYDFAEMFRQQGCVRAIDLDGGGSATFLTKRPGDSGLVYRNSAGDGFERKVSSSLLIVTKSNSKAVTGQATVSMTNSRTVLKKTSGVYSYKVNGKKASGFYAINGNCYLFNSKGKGLSKKIKIGNVTYTFKKGALTKSSDRKAGKVMIGYCGAASGGTNLVYAYQFGNNVLNVGLNPLKKSRNGKMKTWKGMDNLQLPWYSKRSEIRKVYIGNGVTTVGERFLYVIDKAVFDGTKPPTGQLTSVRLPSSLKSIGAFAFYNKPKLKNVVIPAKVTSIDRKAFGYSGKGYLEFKGTKVPKFGSNALTKTGFKQVKVKNNSKWKKFVKAKKLKKLGYKKTVLYK